MLLPSSQLRTRHCLVAFCLLITACGKTSEDNARAHVNEALGKIGLTEKVLSVPKLPFPHSTPARLAAVDAAMQDPLTMIGLSQRIVQHKPAGRWVTYLAGLFDLLNIQPMSVPLDLSAAPTATKVWTQLMDAASAADKTLERPLEWQQDRPVFRALRRLLSAAAATRQAHKAAGGNPTAAEWAVIQDGLSVAVYSVATETKTHRLSLDEYHQVGAKTKVDELAHALLRLLAAVEQAIPELRRATPPAQPLDWQTPLGRVRVAGTGPDHHSGEFLLLVDLGGDDVYEEIGRVLKPGQVSIVIDLAGNDRVTWEKAPGPGAGILGISLWADLSGDDRYTGRNLGMGVGLFGAGLLWDAAGNDLYQGGSRVQGTGQYGVGVLLDGGGNDTYIANLHAQGFGGTGGYGILLELGGDDTYACVPLVPDPVRARNQRQRAVHYVSQCQGYAFGRRPEISGGVGLLLDRTGDDRYEADLFAQGAAYWFGLGMLVEGSGDDHYEAFEHCQGEGLHLSAGILADWSGDDEYAGFEHCQGVGLDRAVGILYEDSGNDRYHAYHKSQGTGLNPYGAGVLIEVAGNDSYRAAKDSQGYSARPPEAFPASEWPVGVLVDLAGEDTFSQPALAPPTAAGRVRNRQGIAVDK